MEWVSPVLTIEPDKNWNITYFYSVLFRKQLARSNQDSPTKIVGGILPGDTRVCWAHSTSTSFMASIPGLMKLWTILNNHASTIHEGFDYHKLICMFMSHYTARNNLAPSPITLRPADKAEVTVTAAHVNLQLCEGKTKDYESNVCDTFFTI